MFSCLSRGARLPVRRCLHTVPPRSQRSFHRLGLTVGASAAVAATYLTWRLTSDSHRIALDSATKLPTTKASSAPSSFSPEKSESTPSYNEYPTSPEPTPEDSQPSEIQVDSSDTEEKPSSDPPSDAEGEHTHDAGSGGAFNPATGEINWDCPCLGGMAHGPCGPEFREAFSCFVFSEEEPKGINCVDKFQAMQTCFREHPEVYGDEIMDDDDDEEAAPAPAKGALLASDFDDKHEGQSDSHDLAPPPEPAKKKYKKETHLPQEDSSPSVTP